ncbi:Nif3-like dinuclear metal center hexameric protein [Oscillospiraceae bacterium MB08-C2-2]|nr:Nif3-like dinuclear metal center hexameric protein [Oscillospiraceae bacterium MB08-C2-2]
MYTVAQCLQALDRRAPFSQAMSWDNCGLLIGGMDTQVTGVLTALDVTGPVIEEAVEKKANLLITHHPVIFSPIKRLEAEGIPYRCISRGLSVISAHTNLDMAPGGVNTLLAQALELENTAPLEIIQTQAARKIVVFVPESHGEAVYEAMSAAGAGKLGNYSKCAFLLEGEGRFYPMEGAHPAIGQVEALEKVQELRIEMLVPPEKTAQVVAAMKEAHPYETPAYDLFVNEAVTTSIFMGVVGECAQPKNPQAFAAFVKQALHLDGLRYVDGGRPITRVAVCGGSGGDYIALALRQGAQALVTADIKHHQLLEAREMGLTLVDAGHFATENLVVPQLAKWLRADLPGLSVECSARSENPSRAL